MEVTVPTTLNVLNGSDARLPCTFNSCYTVNHKQFSLNWTYQECSNCSEEMVSPRMGVAVSEGQEPLGVKSTLPTTCPCPGPGPWRSWWAVCSRGLPQKVCGHAGWPWEGGRDVEVTASLPGKQVHGGRDTPFLEAPCSSSSPPQFLQFRMKIINLKLERFRDRVEFSGNPSKYDVSVTLRNVQLEDVGTYNCYIMNPPDRHRGHGKIYLQVLMEGEGRGGQSRGACRGRGGGGCVSLPVPRPPPAGGAPGSLGGAVPS